LPENRQSFEPTRAEMRRVWGNNYGVHIVNQTPLPVSIIDQINEALDDVTSDNIQFEVELEDNLQREREARKGNQKDELPSAERRRLRELAQEITYKRVPMDKKDPEDMLTILLIKRVRNDTQRLDTITKSEFAKHLESKHRELMTAIPMEKIRQNAKKLLDMMGLMRPTDVQYGKGRYLVVSDSHGKHTPSEMFQLLRVMDADLRFEKIFHIGHILDDDGLVSFRWNTFRKLVIVSRPEEASEIEEYIRGSDGNALFNVVQDEVMLGNLEVSNQDLVQDYSKTMFGGAAIEPQMFPNTVLLSGHRQEMDTRVTHEGVSIVACPGCICTPHIQKAVRKICEGDVIKVVKSQRWNH